jgi:hypothetical protein
MRLVFQGQAVNLVKSGTISYRFISTAAIATCFGCSTRICWRILRRVCRLLQVHLKYDVDNDYGGEVVTVHFVC